MEITNSHVTKVATITSAKGVPSLRVDLSNDRKVRSQLFYSHIDKKDVVDHIKEELPDEIKFGQTEDGEITASEGSGFGKGVYTVYTKSGQFGAYGSLVKPYKYHEYEKKEIGIDEVGSVDIMNTDAFIDDENSLIIKVEDGRLARYINTVVADGEPVIDATTLANNEDILNKFGFTVDDVLNGTDEHHEAQMAIIVKANNNKDKAYLEFGKVNAGKK